MQITNNPSFASLPLLRREIADELMPLLVTNRNF
jgi:hypothetical protein